MRKLRCPHCQKTAAQELMSMFNDLSLEGECGTAYETLKCTTCQSITIQRYAWDADEEEAEVVYETIFPQTKPTGTPRFTVLK